MSSAKTSSMRFSTRQIAFTGVLGAITVVLGMTPQLGFIKLPGIAVTTMHIPTIIAGIVEGPVIGGIVGAMFGLFSMWQAQNIGSPIEKIIFSNPVIAVLPRILIGIVSYYVFTVVRGRRGRFVVPGVTAALFGYSAYLMLGNASLAPVLRWTLAVALAGVVAFALVLLDRKYGHGPALAAAAGSMTNTVLVLSLIVAFGHMPAEAAVAIGVGNGLPEAAVAVVLTSLVYRGIEGLVGTRKGE